MTLRPKLRRDGCGRRVLRGYPAIRQFRQRRGEHPCLPNNQSSGIMANIGCLFSSCCVVIGRYTGVPVRLRSSVNALSR